MALFHLSLILVFSCWSCGFSGTDAAVFTLQNRCERTIWPGILSGAGRPQLVNGGLELKQNEKININAPKGWSGRFWARSECSFDRSGKGRCITGDCGGVVQCAGAGGAPPASLAEFTLDSPLDFYDVSLVDGFNIPISIVPSGGSGNCTERVRVHAWLSTNRNTAALGIIMTPRNASLQGILRCSKLLAQQLIATPMMTPQALSLVMELIT
ncbi:unnamed protein product [Ilex paraguariensis]|uniref:Thaumatin-like protein n=1 Tax=Ilex paraguariensis TaxID=185542 RepID=A0ABC8TQS7_9AQUA